MIYLLYYESATYAGYGQHFVVAADSETQAEELSSDSANDYFREQDEDQYQEENGFDYEEPTWAEFRTCEELTLAHESAKWVLDEGQRCYYQLVNIEEKDLVSLIK